MERLAPPPWMSATETRAVLAALEADGAAVRFVGGSVRDTLLKRAVTDIDIATPDPPERVMTLLGRAGIRAVPTGIAHGTITAISGGRHFEVTTLRVDVRSHGRHAEVAFTDDWEADAARRDFTINAMSCRPDGTLFDYHGGHADLRAGRVRFVGDAAQRIAEDRLRLLRFFRFLAHYGRGAPDGAALAACGAAARSVHRLSGERVSAEMLKLLGAPDPVPTLALMGEAGVLAEVLPEAGPTARLAALVGIEIEQGADPLRRLAALVADGGAETGALAVRWRLSNAARDRLSGMTAPAVDLAAVTDAPARRRALYRLGAPLFRDLVLLAWAGEIAPEPAQEPASERYREMLRSADAWEPPALPVRGADVLALGVSPGPAVGALLEAVEAWWIEADFAPDRPAALAKLAALAKIAAGDR